MPGEPTDSKRIRVLTWNVNGLRACLRRLNTTLSELLDSLHAGSTAFDAPQIVAGARGQHPHVGRDSGAAFCADVVCLQETKLRRVELDRDLALANGWCAPSLADRSVPATPNASFDAFPLAQGVVFRPLHHEAGLLFWHCDFLPVCRYRAHRSRGWVEWHAFRASARKCRSGCRLRDSAREVRVPRVDITSTRSLGTWLMISLASVLLQADIAMIRPLGIQFSSCVRMIPSSRPAR